MSRSFQKDDYDPYAHAEQMGLTIEYQQLRTDYGLYVPQSNLVLLRPRMTVTVERSVLAHEIQHHIHSHRRTSGVWSLRQERIADLEAARQLITPERLHDAQLWSSDPAEWCIDLRVTGDILLAYLRAS